MKHTQKIEDGIDRFSFPFFTEIKKRRQNEFFKFNGCVGVSRHESRFLFRGVNCHILPGSIKSQTPGVFPNPVMILSSFNYEHHRNKCTHT